MKNKLFKEASKLSLENAEQWVTDAQFLIENDSYGHTYALISFVDEEIVKGYICWLVAEKIVPSNSNFASKFFFSLYLRRGSSVTMFRVDYDER